VIGETKGPARATQARASGGGRGTAGRRVATWNAKPALGRGRGNSVEAVRQPERSPHRRRSATSRAERVRPETDFFVLVEQPVEFEIGRGEALPQDAIQCALDPGQQRRKAFVIGLLLRRLGGGAVRLHELFLESANPIALGIRVRNRNTARLRNSCESVFRRSAFFDKDARRDQRGPADAGAAMDANILIVANASQNVAHKKQCGSPIVRDSAIDDRKGNMINTQAAAYLRLIAQTQVVALLDHQQINNRIDAGGFPSRDFIIQPITPTRPGQDGEPLR
jgi:hypothetical protein